MPNRIIREQSRRSKTLDQLSDFAERSWWRLITVCDDFGRFEADFNLLISDLYPLKARILSLRQIAATCGEWQKVGLVRFYTDEEKIYGYSLTWATHQRIRDSKKKHPDPNQCQAIDIFDLINKMEDSNAADCGDLRQIAATCGRFPLARARAHAQQSESNPNPIQSNIYVQKPETFAPIEVSPNGNDPGYSDMFEAVWEHYPRKTGKGAAWRIWQKQKLEALGMNIGERVILAKQELEQWQKDNGQFIPLPATYLSQRRWEDELPGDKRRAQILESALRNAAERGKEQ